VAFLMSAGEFQMRVRGTKGVMEERVVAVTRMEVAVEGVPVTVTRMETVVGLLASFLASLRYRRRRGRC